MFESLHEVRFLVFINLFLNQFVDTNSCSFSSKVSFPFGRKLQGKVNKFSGFLFSTFFTLWKSFIIQLKMINKGSMNNWISMEASVGLHCDLFDSNSRFLNKSKDESLDEGFRYYVGQCEEQYQPAHTLNNENSLNFINIEKRYFTTHPQTPSPFKNDSLSSNANDHRDWAASQNLSKRGLKQLASLLLQTLLKKPFSSHREVAEQIEKHLMHPDLHSVSSSREQKNIKRRIYDALNVMISANVLEKEFQAIEHKAVEKNYSIVNRCEQYNSQLKKVKARIQAKKELLMRMQLKRNALRLWLQKKGRSKEKEGLQRRFQFPIVVLMADAREKIEIEMEKNSVLIQFGQGEVYSETDLLEEFYKDQENKFRQIQLKKEQKFIEEITYI